jgi:hypothetical protein
VVIKYLHHSVNTKEIENQLTQMRHIFFNSWHSADVFSGALL